MSNVQNGKYYLTLISLLLPIVIIIHIIVTDIYYYQSNPLYASQKEPLMKQSYNILILGATALAAGILDANRCKSAIVLEPTSTIV